MKEERGTVYDIEIEFVIEIWCSFAEFEERM